MLAQWNIAMDDLYRAIDFCTPGSIKYAEALMRLGHLKSKQKEYGAARQFYRESTQIYEQVGETGMPLNIQICFGYNAFEQGDYLEAGLGDRLNQAEVRHAYGSMLARQGDRGNARRQLEAAPSIFTELGASQDMTNVKRELGMLVPSSTEKSTARSIRPIRRIGKPDA